MMIINAQVDPTVTREDWLSVSKSQFTELDEFFRQASSLSSLTLDVAWGVLEYSDGTRVPFRNYRARVVSTYESPDGDTWWVAADGGHANVSKIVRMAREEWENARSGS